MIKNIFPILCFMIVSDAFAQTKIIQHKTDVPWADGGIYNYRWMIGSDFLAQPVNRNMTQPNVEFGQDQILYIFDLKNRMLSKVFDQANRGWYFVAGSGITSSFLLGYTSLEKNGDKKPKFKPTTGLWIFNEKTRNWTCSFTNEGAGPQQYGSLASTAPVHGYYVEPKESADHKLVLEIYEY
jgi:hypothetical protein